MNNRTIKFRAYDTKNKKWLDEVPPEEHMLDNDDCWDTPDYGEMCEALSFYPHNPLGSSFNGRVIYQQFTGSLDKNANPIYESDIVLWDQQDPFDCTPSKTKKVVGWNQRCMQYRLYDFPNEIGEKGGEEFLAEDVVVIGNIFDWKNEDCRYLLDESVKNNL